MNELPFKIIRPSNKTVPILVSVPHCGVSFPDEIKDEYNQQLAKSPDDTDWFVDRLYDFVGSMGISMIHAVYSRWVIDLNRDPDSKPLYNDGRIITALCPTTDFLGQSIYSDNREEVSQTEVKRRVEKYYRPYHQQIDSLLAELKSTFEQVLLWDCHSIRHIVPTIRPERFPDLILGDADGTSASPGLIETTLATLEQSGYGVSHNHPFKGGYITRSFGRPVEGVHALQLEMNKINYMDDSETGYDEQRAEKVRALLKKTFENLTELL